MSERRPIYEVIKENIIDGRLPESFSLPKYDEDPNAVKWADGARDGVGIFHMGRPDIKAEDMQLVKAAFDNVGDTEKAQSSMRQFFEKVYPVWAIDAIQGHIIDDRDNIDADTAFRFAVDCLNSSKTDMVKLGLIITELFGESDIVREYVCTLGLSDEFTIFAIFNMMTWDNGNDEVFRLAQKVNGWGRIHAVERLEPATPEIKAWLLKEGIKNDIMAEYSVLDVYRKADVYELLCNNVSDEQLDSIASVINAMLDEGPALSISTLPEDERDDMISRFIAKTGSHAMSFDILNCLFCIPGNENLKKFKDDCKTILTSERSKEVLEKALEHGEGANIAIALGIPYKEKLFGCINADFDKNARLCYYIMDDDEYREKTIALFRKKLPLADMQGEPTLNKGFSREYADNRKLEYLLTNAALYPLCCTDIALAALRSPISTTRAQAVRTISKWCEDTGSDISSLSAELAAAVNYLRTAEPDEGIRKQLESFFTEG